MALAAVDWGGWKDEAKAFLRLHPGVAVAELTWGERVVIPGAKEAFAVATWGAQAAVRAVGGQPCAHCGTWTGSFCEGCEDTPVAICTRCDRERLLCPDCIASSLLYKDVERSDNAGILEVTGHHDEHGNFVRYEKPPRFPTSEVPKHADGTFNIDELMAFVERGARPGEQDGASTAARGQRAGARGSGSSRQSGP